MVHLNEYELLSPFFSALQAKFYKNNGLSSMNLCENCISEGIYNSEDENG